MDDTSYSLEVRFPDQSPSFTYGFEAGEIYGLMKQDIAEIDRGIDEGFPLREENNDLYDSLAQVKGYVVERRAPTDGWVPTKFSKVKETEKRPHLRVVE